MNEFRVSGLSDEDLPVLTDVASEEKKPIVMPNLTVNVSTVENLTLLTEGIPFSSVSSEPIFIEKKSVTEDYLPEEKALDSSDIENISHQELIPEIAEDNNLLAFELLLVDEQQPAEKQDSTQQKEVEFEQSISTLPAASVQKNIGGDALSDIERRIAELSVKSVLNSTALNHSFLDENPTEQSEEVKKPKMAVLGEAALTEAVYNASLPQIKHEVKAWLRGMLLVYSERMTEGILRQFETDCEVIFGDTLHKNIRKSISEARRNSVVNKNK